MYINCENMSEEQNFAWDSDLEIFDIQNVSEML
jgi:hypothetical protein